MPIFNMVGGGGFKSLGNKWLERSTLPYEFHDGSAVVLNNEIHILGSSYYSGGYAYGKNHYSYSNAYIK